MTRRLFVCHANADIEATSEVVDALENTLSFRAGTLWTSSIPGYATEADDGAALRGVLAGSDMVLAIVTQVSVRDPRFLFQLGAAWALGAYTVLYLLDAPAHALLPLELGQAPVVYVHQPEQWSTLVGDLSVRLGLVPRPAASTRSSVPPLPKRDRASEPAAGAGGSSPPSAAVPPPLPVPTATPLPHTYLDELRSIGGTPDTIQPSDVRPLHAAQAPDQLDELDELAETEATTNADVARQDRDLRPPPTHSYIEQLGEPSEAAELSPHAHAPQQEEPPTGEQLRVDAAQTDDGQPLADDDEDDAQTIDSDVYARLPTCEMALEAGRAVSDCVFNRAEIDDFATELDDPLGKLVESMGASWSELRGEHDLDTWIVVTDQLLQTLPDEVRKIEEWYKVGFELATLHNLAGQLVLDGSDATAEQHWRGALERFLMRAERAEIGYENLGRVLGLLENLAGPSQERDLANIPRSLEELRRYAAGADIHSAA